MISAKYRTYHIKIVVLYFVFIAEVHFIAHIAIEQFENQKKES